MEKFKGYRYVRVFRIDVEESSRSISHHDGISGQHHMLRKTGVKDKAEWHFRANQIGDIYLSCMLGSLQKHLCRYAGGSNKQGTINRCDR